MLPRERFIEVDYEALIADREAVTRQLIAFGPDPPSPAPVIARAAGDEAISMVWSREIPRLLRCARNDSKGDNPCVKPAGDEASPEYDRARKRLRVTGSCDRLASEITEAPR